MSRSERFGVCPRPLVPQACRSETAVRIIFPSRHVRMSRTGSGAGQLSCTRSLPRPATAALDLHGDADHGRDVTHVAHHPSIARRHVAGSRGRGRARHRARSRERGRRGRRRPGGRHAEGAFGALAGRPGRRYGARPAAHHGPLLRRRHHGAWHGPDHQPLGPAECRALHLPRVREGRRQHHAVRRRVAAGGPGQDQASDDDQLQGRHDPQRGRQRQPARRCVHGGGRQGHGGQRCEGEPALRRRR